MLCVCVCQAQRDTTTLQSVEVQGQMLRRSVTSAFSTQQMSHEEMQQQGITDMADVLRRMAGTNIKDYGGLGGMKTVSVRNMGAAHTAVAYDGLPVSNCQAGQIDVGRFDLRHLQSVSLTVGHEEEMLQCARLYASGAVLGLQSLQPVFLPGRRWSMEASCRTGLWGEVSPNLSWQQQVGEGTVVGASANFLRSDGGYPFSLQIPGVGTEQRHRTNNDIREWRGEINTKTEFRKGGQLRTKAYVYDAERGLPGHVIYYNVYNQAERLWDRNAFLQVQYRKPLGTRWSLLAQGKYNYSWNRYRIESETYAEGYSQDRNTQHEGFVSMAAQYKASSHWNFSLSQDAVLNTLRSSIPHSPLPDRYTSLTALNARYENACLRITGTLVNTFIAEHVQKGEQPANQQRLSPTVALRYAPNPSVPLYLRTMYKNTFRAPSFNDLYYQRLGNIHLKPEKTQELSAGITYAPYKLGLFRKTSLTLDGYWSDVKDKIVAIPTSYVWSMRNYGHARMAGLDVTLHTSLPVWKEIALDVNGAYSWMRAIDVTDPARKSYRHQLPYTPHHSGNVGLLLRTPWANLGYTIMAVGLRYMEAQNIAMNEVKGYQDHTLTVSKELALKDCRLNVLASVVNLLDAQYDVIRYYPMPGRRYTLTVEVKL